MNLIKKWKNREMKKEAAGRKYQAEREDQVFGNYKNNTFGLYH